MTSHWSLRVFKYAFCHRDFVMSVCVCVCVCVCVRLQASVPQAAASRWPPAANCHWTSASHTHKLVCLCVYLRVWWPLFCLVGILSQVFEVSRSHTHWQSLTLTTGDGQTDRCKCACVCVCVADVNDERKSLVTTVEITAYDPLLADTCMQRRTQ